MVLRAFTLGPLVRLGWGAFSAHSFGDDRLPRCSRSWSIPLGRLVPLPTPPPDALRPWCPYPLLWRLLWPPATAKPAAHAPCNNRCRVHPPRPSSTPRPPTQ